VKQSGRGRKQEGSGDGEFESFLDGFEVSWRRWAVRWRRKWGAKGRRKRKEEGRRKEAAVAAEFEDRREDGQKERRWTEER